MLENILKSRQLTQAAGLIGSAGRSVRLGGVWGSSGALVAAALGRLARRPVLFVTAHLDDADELADDVEVLTGKGAQLFPAWEVDVGTEHVNDEIVGERLRLCNLLARGPGEAGGESAEFIVAPVMALLQPVPTRAALDAGRLEMRSGGQVAIDSLLSWLVDAGYDRVDQVDQQGEFASRGGIVDVFPPGVGRAVRVEFFGDTVASIRLFDLDTQRSTEQIDGYDLTSIAAGRQLDPANTTHLLDYLPAETIVCMLEPQEVADLAEELFRRVHEDIGDSKVARLGRPEELFQAARRFPTAEMYTFSPKRQAGTFDLGIRSLQRISLNTREAFVEMEELSAVCDVWVYCETAAEQARFAELLKSSHPVLADRVHTAVGHVHRGFHWPDERLVVVGHHEVFHRYAKVRRIRRIRTGRPIETLLDLTEGDYVVHVAHGIAKFEGLRALEQDGRKEEYLRLRFADSALLHVPASRIDLVQKYIGAARQRPSLSRLGGAGWSRRKERAEEAVKDLAAEMLRVQAMRLAQPGASYPAGTDWQRKFTDEFIYTETEDQLEAMSQIERDMHTPRPMDRLLCGDVGYGKTELAMRAAFKAAEAGRQAAVLVPTTVLADQHYRTFRERFADYPFEIEVLSRFRKPAEQANVLARLEDAKVDILIGTHRILSDDVRFADLALVVIDEEQRFGVEHKERLKRMRASVEVLTMTATPIPRTLHMALLGLRDISSLSTPPLDRRSIYTEVCHYDERLIRKAVLRELNRRGQVFYVHNRVHNIQSVADSVRRVVPEARVAFGHGQMAGRELEEVMLRFVRGETDVLVCTTIIESGLDIPTANTMIVRDADRFGLAELHQLRGRVGRCERRAFCYLLLPERRTVSPQAAKRLKAIEEFSDLGAGFQIAMRDLEIRGAGNILGAAQSGHIAAVGYELYCRLLQRAVAELKGRPLPQRRGVHLELGIDAYIPRLYVPSQRQRMELYRRLADCSDTDQLRRLAADMDDAFGPLPTAVDTLLDLAEIRIRAAEAGIDSIILMEPDLVFTIRDFQAAKALFEGAAGSVRLPDEKTAHWRLPEAYRQMPTLVNVLLNRLRRAAASV